MVNFDLDEDGLPVVPELSADKKNAGEVEEATKLRGTKQRELTAKLKKENENLSKGLNADGTPKKKEEKKQEKSEIELDKGDRAILRAEKITSEEEMDLVKSWMKDTGKDVEGVLNTKRFQDELKDFRDGKATEAATPKDKKRNSSSARDTVDYWLEKSPEQLAELRKENPTLARKVVNEKMKVLKEKNQFSDTPVV